MQHKLFYSVSVLECVCVGVTFGGENCAKHHARAAMAEGERGKYDGGMTCRVVGVLRIAENRACRCVTLPP